VQCKINNFSEDKEVMRNSSESEVEEFRLTRVTFFQFTHNLI
jgi:hypothetical protein